MVVSCSIRVTYPEALGRHIKLDLGLVRLVMDVDRGDRDLTLGMRQFHGSRRHPRHDHLQPA